MSFFRCHKAGMYATISFGLFVFSLQEPLSSGVKLSFLYFLIAGSNFSIKLLFIAASFPNTKVIPACAPLLFDFASRCGKCIDIFFRPSFSI